MLDQSFSSYYLKIKTILFLTQNKLNRTYNYAIKKFKIYLFSLYELLWLLHSACLKKAECTKISPKKSFSNIPKYIPIPACGKDTSCYSIIHETFDEFEWYHHVSLNKTFVINNKNIFRSGQ